MKVSLITCYIQSIVIHICIKNVHNVLWFWMNYFRNPTLIVFFVSCESVSCRWYKQLPLHDSDGVSQWVWTGCHQVAAVYCKFEYYVKYFMYSVWPLEVLWLLITFIGCTEQRNRTSANMSSYIGRWGEVSERGMAQIIVGIQAWCCKTQTQCQKCYLIQLRFLQAPQNNSLIFEE